MDSDCRPKCKQIHNRNISISTYEYDDKNIAVEGELKENILIPIFVSGKKRRPHTVHHMIIRILIGYSSLTIREIEVKMPGTPYEECQETSNSLDAIRGLKIASGFTSKVKKILGQRKRCLHLTNLLLAMVQAVMQGYWVYSARKPKEKEVSSDMVDNYLIDSCWVWRKDGPLVNRLSQKGRRDAER